MVSAINHASSNSAQECFLTRSLRGRLWKKVNVAIRADAKQEARTREDELSWREATPSFLTYISLLLLMSSPLSPPPTPQDTLHPPQPRSQGLSSPRPLGREEERPWERGCTLPSFSDVLRTKQDNWPQVNQLKRI